MNPSRFGIRTFGSDRASRTSSGPTIPLRCRMYADTAWTSSAVRDCGSPHAELLARAEKIARHICTLPPVAVRMMKEFVVRFGDLPTDQAWHVQNLINHLLIQTTTDGEEGRRAFNEKRPPNFTGKLRRRGDAWPELSEEDAKRLDDVYRSGEF